MKEMEQSHHRGHTVGDWTALGLHKPAPTHSTVSLTTRIPGEKSQRNACGMMSFM